MEALKKQASKLREHVAKQQQAVIKQFSARYNQDPSLVDEAELECHQNLQRLYNTTRAAKHFQRNIVRGVEGFIAVSTKQMEIVKKLAEDCCKYGNDNQNFGFVLARASIEFGKSHSQMEKERENLLKVVGGQVFEPLREMIMSAPLEDARLLTYRYQRIRQDMESQIADVMRKQLKSKESSGNADSSVKLQHAESKLSELRTTLAALGREATAAMEAVEAQQQQVTFDRLLAMVDAERAYHQNAADILNKLHDEMLHAKQHDESENQYDEPSAEHKTAPTHVHSHSSSEDPVLTKTSKLTRNETSEPTRNGEEVHYVGELLQLIECVPDGGRCKRGFLTGWMEPFSGETLAGKVNSEVVHCKGLVMISLSIHQRKCVNCMITRDDHVLWVKLYALCRVKTTVITRGLSSLNKKF